MVGNGLALVPTDQVLVNAAGMAEREGEEVTEGEVLEAPMEEVNPRKHLPSPTMPSASAVAQHRENHLPYASWCDECVEGRGQ